VAQAARRLALRQLLTRNRMGVVALATGVADIDTLRLQPGALPEALHALLEVAVLASETEPHNPMERALHRMAAEQLAGTEHLHPQWTLAREYELSPELLAMCHLRRSPDVPHDVVASKGAPEVMAQAATMADRGLRVLGVARARHRSGKDWPGVQHDFAFDWVGLVGWADPIRTEVPEAMAQCRRAGIRVVMITGDHSCTARAIASQAGISSDRVLTDDEVLLLDAAALKAAHIGIAMGQHGTDVAREAASLMLLQDDFASSWRPSGPGDGRLPTYARP